MKNIKRNTKYSETTPLYNLTLEGDEEISLSKGNDKLGKGIYAFSTLPGEHVIAAKTCGLLTNILGTCSGCCNGCENGGCYAISDAKQHHNVTIPAWGKNTLMLRKDEDKVFAQLKDILTKKKAVVLRYNVSGEIETYSQLEKLVQLALDMPKLTVYFYTKRFDYVTRYLSEHKNFPANMACNISKWHDNIDNYDFLENKNVNIFAYDDGQDESIKNWIACPAVDKNGHRTGVTCDQCRRCTKNSGMRTRVYAH